MLRGYDYGLLTTLAAALAYGALYAVVELTWGLIAVALFAGWLIGSAIRRGVMTALLRRYPASTAPEGGSVHRPWPRGTSTVAALLGVLAWFVGNYVAFAIIQLVEGAGPIADRLAPANFAAFLAAITEPPLLQAAVLAGFLVVAAYTARAPSPKQRPDNRR